MSTLEQLDAPAERSWSRPEFMRIAHRVGQVTGIAFPPNRRASAELVIRRVMSKLGIADAVTFEIGVARGGNVMTALLDSLTVGESYFFREPAQFRFMAEELLPKWNSTWDAGRKLNVWSAGCAAGQEPYSVAIMLRENGWNRGARILGTDISQGRLTVARDASFTKWSLRTMPHETVERWFEKKGSNFVLLPSVKSEVEFTVLNLLDPTPRPETLGQDAIFCRNVLIYFDLPAVVQIAERLLQSLAPDGWLFLGASDPHLAELTPCEVVVLPGCTAYRRTSATESTYAVRHAPLTLLLPEELSAMPASVAVAVDASPIDDWNTNAIVGIERDEGPLATLSDAVDADGPEHAIALARELANKGKLNEAGQVCASALERFPDQARLHLIAAILSGEAGRWVDSERSARRALYLDRSFVLAHVALGDALARIGNAARARRSFENAAALLTSASDEAMDGSEEMPAARLMDIVRAHLSMLDSDEGTSAVTSRRAVLR